jgi:hypothetical protein
MMVQVQMEVQGLVFDYQYGGKCRRIFLMLRIPICFMNNIMHDVWYQYGFNEANGNFQENNYQKVD